MATRLKIPAATVPMVDPKTGLPNPDWYKFLERLPIAGEVATSATAGAADALPATPSGYHTQIINGAPKKVAHYDE